MTTNIIEKPRMINPLLNPDPIKYYIIMIGDEFTIKFHGLGYHYEMEDIRKKDSMPLTFDTEEEAKKYMDTLLELVYYYTNKIKNNVNHSKAIDDAKYELEKITSTNKSIIIPLILDLVYHVNKKQNPLGFYDMQYTIVTDTYVEKQQRIYEYKQSLLNKEEES